MNSLIGTSSGLGRSLVQTVLERGYNVVATARNVESLKEFSTESVIIRLFMALLITLALTYQ